MKRIFSFALAAIMLLSAMVFSTSAAGTLIFSDTFDSGFMPRNWIQDGDTCAYEWDKYNQCIHGYDKAKVLQSNFGKKYDRWWAQFYTSFDFQVRGFDDLPEQEGRMHDVALWYNDLMETGVAADDVKQRGANYLYTVEIETGKAILEKTYDFAYKDEFGVTQQGSVKSVICEGQIPVEIEVAEDAAWYNIGMRVESGKITCYFNEEIVFSSSAADSTEKIGHVSVDSVDDTVGSEKSAILFFNGGNWIALDNFEVWTPDYDFEEAAYGDLNGDEQIDVSDVTLTLKIIAKWNLADVSTGAADVNVDGTVDLLDVTKLLRYVAGWEDVVLGPAK